MSSNNPDSLMQQALKKETQKGFFSGPKLDEAYDLYVQAANLYKLQKNYNKAGQAFSKAALIAEKLDEQFDASQQYINASKSMKPTDPKEACNMLKLAINILCKNGRFSSAANYEKEIALINEQELNNKREAIEAYELAAEWYEAEGSSAIANSCKLKAADLLAYEGNYTKAIQAYETIAKTSAENDLMKWSVKEYLLKSGLCQICSSDICESMEGDEIEKFNETVINYDNISKLDELKTKLLLKIKQKFDEEPDLT